MTRFSRIPLNNTHILVVDDEPEIAESLADYLIKKEGFRVDVASGGHEATQFLQATIGTSTEIDLVLLDMRMPQMSGLDVLQWIRNNPDLQLTRVVLLTAAAGSREKVEALSAGADDYITKPYYMQELLARVKTILRTQQLEKQLQQQSQQLATLNEFSKTISALLDSQQILNTAVESINKVIEIDLAGIWMLESSRLHCRHIYHKAKQITPADFVVLRQDQGLMGHIFHEQKTVILNNPHADPRFRPQYDTPAGYAVRSLIAAPLLVRGRPVGVFCAYNKQTGSISEVDLDIFASFVSSVAESVENAWLFQRIRLRQQELRESRNALKALIDGIPNQIYTINDNWELIAINQSKADQLEATEEELIGKICYEAFYGRFYPCDHCLAAQTLIDKNAQNWLVSWMGEDHLAREWDVNAYPIPTSKASSARAVIVWQDKTEERRLENSLMQAGKLAAIGQLAAGVAHEINNPLTAVNANAQMIKMVMPPDDENYDAVDLILQAGERAAKVVRGLLDFARQEQYSFIEGDINASINQALDLVRYQLRTANINTIREEGVAVPQITASWEHLKSVWLNLLLNARDALLENEEARQIEIITGFDENKNIVQVLIHDNGKGISQAELAHIFEPFYTTKDPGKGTGLGLATCHRIIE
ncbi:MAG: response regulator, partial [Anaerolineales bacterium]|nr:response regulator [Anaerolineales bacterium]